MSFLITVIAELPSQIHKPQTCRCPLPTARYLPHHATMVLYPAPPVWAQAPGLSERTRVLNTLLGWCTKCRLLACPEREFHTSRDIKLWYGHSCSLRQGARVLHDAAATYLCPLSRRMPSADSDHHQVCVTRRREEVLSPSHRKGEIWGHKKD